MTEVLAVTKAEVDRLVVRALIDAALEKRKAAEARLADIAQQRAAAEAAALAANNRYQAALNGDGDCPVLEAGRQMAAAANELAVMEDAHGRAVRIVQDAVQAQLTAQRRAWAPVVMEAIRRRVAAAAAADAAREALDSAAEAYAQADALMRWAAHEKQAAVPPADGWSGRVLGNTTAAQERKFWEANHVDFATGTFPGMPAQDEADRVSCVVR